MLRNADMDGYQAQCRDCYWSGRIYDGVQPARREQAEHRRRNGHKEVVIARVGGARRNGGQVPAPPVNRRGT